MVAVVAAADVTAGTAAGVAAPLGAPAGSDCDAAPGRRVALEADLTDAPVAEVVWAGDQAASPGNTLCFGRRLVCTVDPSVSLADELVWTVRVCRALPGDDPVDAESSAFASPFGSDESDEAELVGDLDPESPESAAAVLAPPKITATTPTHAPTRTAR
ncbi:MAG: hypothetical protein NVSMB60_06440 [Mycobacterium sp.]